MNDRPRVTLRQATLTDQVQILDVITESRREAMPWLPIVHTPCGRRVVGGQQTHPRERRLGGRSGRRGSRGLCHAPGWIEQLYIDPSAQGTGLGSDLSVWPNQCIRTVFNSIASPRTTARPRSIDRAALRSLRRVTVPAMRKGGAAICSFEWRPERDAVGVSRRRRDCHDIGGPAECG